LTSLKEIKDIYPDPQLLSATLTIGWLTVLYPNQKDMLLQGFVRHGTVLDEQTRARIAQQLGVTGEFDEQGFIKWFTQQNTSIIRLIRYLIDTKPLLDKHRDLILENDEEEELDLGNVERTVPQEPIQPKIEQTKQPPMEQIEPVDPEQVTASLQT